MKMRIEKILNLDDGEHRFHFKVVADEMGLDLKDFEGRVVFDKSVVAHAILNKTGHTYYLKIAVLADARLLCDRCLEDVRKSVEGSFETVYTDARNRDDFGEENEIRLIDTRKANEIVIDKDVKDTLILALPTKVLCKDDCRGLCPECGANLNEATCSHVREAENV